MRVKRKGDTVPVSDEERDWLIENITRRKPPVPNIKARESRAARRDRVIRAYGGRCACCGEDHRDFLAIDHIHNDGAAERSKGMKGDMLVRHIIREGYPDDYQLLCHNCNMSKHLNGGVCIHELERA